MLKPKGARWIYVLAHGAGAGMGHPFMEGVAQALARRGVATWRWQMQYLTEGRRPDTPARVIPEVRAAVAAARKAAPRLRLVAGGKSFGGRMTSAAEAESPLGVEGLVYLGFPLHPDGKPATTRAAHLPQIAIPQLFVSGDRDGLAELSLLRPIVASLAKSKLSIIAGADHGFAVAKRSGRDALAEIADTVRAWLDTLP
jgi:predicted alpha/beta-hydrolase family hydrolase